MNKSKKLNTSQSPGTRKTNRFSGILLRTALFSWLVSIATISIFAFYVIPQQKQIFLDVLESKAHVLATSIHDVAASAVVTEDYSEVVDHCMEIIRVNESVSYLVLTRNDGFSLVHTKDGWTMEELDGMWSHGLGNDKSTGTMLNTHLTEEEAYHYNEAFDYSGINWGRVHVGLSLDQYHAGIQNVIKRTALVGLFCVLFGLMASLLYAGRLVKPILLLEGAVHRVAVGDLDARADIHSGDEVESLANAFNSMTQSIQDREVLVRSQNENLAQLVTEKALHSGNIQKAAEQISEVVSETLSVERVGVWLYNTTKTKLECITQFNRTDRTHSKKGVVKRAGNETYFDALEKTRVLVVDDAIGDLRTCSMAESYLKPQNIASLLDSAIRIDGEVVGVVCHEHAGELRSWSVDEENFAGSVADLVALALEARDRRTSQEQLLAAKDAAEAASEAKSRFLATMSHEIRTPLNGVVGMLKLLRESSLDSKQQRFVTKGILSSEALLVVINDVLDFSKIEAGKLEVEHLKFNPVDITENVVQMFAQQAEEKGLELACMIHDNVPRVALGDPSRIGQVLINLISNAIKFTEQGEVVIRVQLESEAEEQVVIALEIKDTGVGVALKDKDRIFEPFLQEDNSTTRQYGGTGLGLGISRQLVELMGGKIQVDSIPGKGSTFRFTLRLGKVPASDIPKRLNGMRGMNALVVDDHEINREIISYELQSWGCSTSEAGHGEKALELMRKQLESGKPFDFAVIDWNMPGMNGEELCRQIKADPQLAPTPLILLSSVSGIQPSRLQELGLSAWLAKPARQSELHDAITNSVNGIEAPVYRKSTASPAALPKANQVRVLLAEDNEINQEVALEILKMSGYDCDIACNGREAIDAVAENTYDIIFMDCMMPELDGYGATRHIRQNEKKTGRRVPIVALTANAMKGDREICLDSGMDDYLSKPLDPAEVVEMISKWYVDSDVEDKPAILPECDMLADDDLLLFDREAVLKRCMGNGSLVDKLLTKFFGQVDEDIRDLGAASASSDSEKIVQSAHRIKGAAANLSMESLRVIAAEIESYGRNGDCGAAADGFRKLSSEIIRTKEFIAAAPSA